jgi:hypothetical protein
MTAIVWPFLIYWLVLFVACFTVVEVGHDWPYDEGPKWVGWRVTGGSFILAVFATWLRPSFDTLFTTDIAWTLLQAIVWFGVFTLIFEFHPWHALAASLATLVLVPGVATMGVESLTKPASAIAPAQSRPSYQPIRKPLSPAAPAKKAG